LPRDYTLNLHWPFSPEWWPLCSGIRKKAYIHSSGHASPDILHRFVETMRPAMLIPVHGENWGYYASVFDGMSLIANGEWIEVGGNS